MVIWATAVLVVIWEVVVMATWEEEATWEAEVVDLVETWAIAEAILAPITAIHLVSVQTDHKFKVWRHQDF